MPGKKFSIKEALLFIDDEDEDDETEYVSALVDDSEEERKMVRTVCMRGVRGSVDHIGSGVGLMVVYV